MRNQIKVLVGCLGVGALVAAIGCSGDTDGGAASDEKYGGGVFVADDENTGGLEIVPNTTDGQVGEVIGFKVLVKRGDGAGLANVQVVCDSERGLAILEPLAGNELTNEDGMMSGKVGCSQPGSLQLVCRTSVGGNRRDFAEFRCSGPIPAGFNGFGGAAGGGLGGGVLVDDDDPSSGVGGSGGESFRVTDIQFYDTGNTTTATTSIDTQQSSNCNTDPTATPVPEFQFFDSVVGMKVVNNTNQTLRISKVTYTVTDGTASGNFRSDELQPYGQIEVEANGGAATINVLVFRASGGRKYYHDGTIIPLELGFRRVDFKVYAESDNLSSDAVATGGAVVSFGIFNRCPNAG